MNGLIVLIAIATVATIWLKLFLKKPQPRKGEKPAKEMPYQVRGPLFTPAESAFYGALSQAISKDQQVLGKVRVADVLEPVSGRSRSEWQGAFNRISAKHFDFVICDRATSNIQAVVELHDKSHQQASRAQRDQFLRKACQSAGLTLLEFRAKATYSIPTLQSALAESCR